VYDKPVINFTQGMIDDGTFGFDDATEIKLKNDYYELTDSIFHKKFSINKTKKYFTRWLTLKPNQTIDLDIDKSYIKNFMANDSVFSLKFTSSSTDFTLNNNNEIEYNYSEIESSPYISIESKNESLINYNANFITPEVIRVTDQSNELIGKINVVLGKIKHLKEIVFVRIKHDATDFATFDKTSTLSLLNSYSYNQTYIKWENTITDTLNVTNDYNIHPLQYTSSTRIINRVISLYDDINTLDPSKYYVFITDITSSNTQGNIAGRALSFDTNKLILFKHRGLKTIIHEIGHCLGLKHTFDDTILEETSKGTTKSFMDYSSQRNMFFLYQLNHLFNYQFP